MALNCPVAVCVTEFGSRLWTRGPLGEGWMQADAETGFR